MICRALSIPGSHMTVPLMAALSGALVLAAPACADVTLVRSGVPAAQIVVRPGAPEPERFAASELQRYLKHMSGAELPVVEQAVPGRSAVYVGGQTERARSGDPWDDTFRIEVRRDRITLEGQNPRATLFAAYALLERLGCRWFAPRFSFYAEAGAERVPHSPNLKLNDGQFTERPAMRYRAKYVEEGRTHTPENLPALVDWMAKTRQNVFCCPMDYGGAGRVRWDRFREALVPELKKRGLLIEVGGHGYQNFLPVDRYFAEHPDWFGMDEKGQRSRARNRVFETSNTEAMAEFTRNVLAYLRAHPEIDIFDLWPPDGARWSEDPASHALGEPPVRHALVVNQIAEAVARELPQVTVEFIAYQNYLTPPAGVSFGPNTLVGFCPISQSFTTGIDDPGNATNKAYWDALQQWQQRKDVAGRIYVYSYYRKYAWQSLPVLTPHLIGSDMRTYRGAGVTGLSSYSEPGDWLTYELQHLALARAAWNSTFDADALIRDYCRDRFGRASGSMRRFFAYIETTVPQAAAIPGTPAPTAEALERHLGTLAEAQAALGKTKQQLATDPRSVPLVERLGGALEYARLELWRRVAPGRSEEATRQLRALLAAHSDQGLFASPDSILRRFQAPRDAANGVP